MSIEDKDPIFIDSNVFLAVIRATEEGSTARALLNRNDVELGTSLMNLVEVRNVVMKKDHCTREQANQLVDWVETHIDFVVKEFPPMPEIDEVHNIRLLDPMDAIFYCMSSNIGARFSSLENQLQDHGAFPPNQLI